MRNLLDLCMPPSGGRLEWGVWLTHDVDWAGAALGVLPALAGSEEADPRRRELDGRRFAPSRPLLVIHDADRLTGRAATNGVEIVAAPTGRTQHAKVVLLAFEGRRREYRAAVTSANLTFSGFTSNRELLVHEVSDKRPGALFGSLVDALLDLSRGPLAGSAAGDRLTFLSEESRSADADGVRVLHSWGDEQSLLAQLPAVRGVAEATRLTVIDPGFARGAELGLVHQLRAVFGAVEHIELYVPLTAEGGAASFSDLLLDGLRRTFSTVVVHGIDATGAAGRRARPLHAKAVAWDGPGGAGSLVGSANFTSRGLGGGNLEVSVVTPTTASQLLKTLDAEPVEVRNVVTRSPQPDPSDVPRLQASATVDRHDRRAGLIEVRLTIRADRAWPTRPPWAVWDAAGQIDQSGWRRSRDGTICRGVVASIDDSNWVIELVREDRRLAIPVDVDGWDPGEPADDDVDGAVDDPLQPTLSRFEQILASRGAGVAGDLSSRPDAVDVLARPDDSIVHVLARAAIEACKVRGRIDRDEILMVLGSDALHDRLSAGERWALEAMVGARSDRTAKKLERIVSSLK